MFLVPDAALELHVQLRVGAEIEIIDRDALERRERHATQIDVAQRREGDRQ